MDSQILTEIVRDMGAHGSAVIKVADIPFRREFRQACEQNSCGKYGRCWMCPPDVGNIDVLIDRAKAYKKAFIFQSVGQLEDPLDIEGMEDSAKAHNRLTHSLADRLTPFLKEPLQLAAGACQTCECCTRIDNLPCRNPDKALASLEAYGIAVSELAALCGMNYINGVNTVTYFGAFLYNDI